MLNRYLTRTLNMARFLARKYFRAGRGPFREELELTVRFLAEQFGDRPDELRTHLEALLDSLLFELCDGGPDRISRRKAGLSNAWQSEPGPGSRAEAFLADADTLIETLEQDLAAERLGEQVVLCVKSSPDQELRAMTLESLADSFHYSRTYLAERFRRDRGITVHDFLTHEKMHRAFRRLSEDEPAPTVRELSERLGFSDPVYFSRVFRKIYGRLPSQVRGE